MAQTVKKLHAMEETGVQSLGQEDALEKRKATHFSILTWRIVHGVAKSQTQLSNFHFHHHPPHPMYVTVFGNGVFADDQLR